jgi:hypothetical protein
LKSTPIVEAMCSSKVSSVKRSSIEDLPTPASPTSSSLNTWSGLDISWWKELRAEVKSLKAASEGAKMMAKMMAVSAPETR